MYVCVCVSENLACRVTAISVINIQLMTVTRYRRLVAGLAQAMHSLKPKTVHRDVPSGKDAVFLRKFGLHLQVTFDQYPILIHHTGPVHLVQ